MSVIDDQALNEKEIQDLLKSSENPIFLKANGLSLTKISSATFYRGGKQWPGSVRERGVTFAEGMRWLSGIGGRLDGDCPPEINPIPALFPVNGSKRL